MKTQLVCTNLGKWGAVTQTYEEHVNAVWSFRKPLLSVVYKWLDDTFTARGLDVQDFWEVDYLPTVRFETKWHDYDKNFVPHDRLNDLKTFSWHGNPDDPVNKLALEHLLDEHLLEECCLPTDRNTWTELLRAANYSHEGLLTPDKAIAIREALIAFGDKSGWPLNKSDYDMLANLHIATLRAADAMASASDKVAYKDDVSRFVNIIQQVLPGSVLKVINIAFDMSFSESSSSAVLAGYYRFYDVAYHALDAILLRNGLVIGDNSRTLLGLALTDKSDDILISEWQVEVIKALTVDPGTSIEDKDWNTLWELCEFAVSTVNPLDNPDNFDRLVRNSLWIGLSASHLTVVDKQGFPCGSCGRNVVDRPIDRATDGLGTDVSSPESRGDFGFVRSIKKNLFNFSRSIDKTKRLVCSKCAVLASLAEGEPHQATLVIGNLKREYKQQELSIRLTSDRGDPLTQVLLAFRRQQDILAKLANSINLVGGEAQRVAGSILRIKFTPDLPGLARGFVEPVFEAVRPMEVELPDACLSDALDVGFRIGTGPLFLGCKVHDTVYLQGVHSMGTYYKRLERALELHELFAKLSSDNQKKALHALRTKRSIPSLCQAVINADSNSKLELDDVLQIANAVSTKPGAIEDLFSIYRGDTNK